MTRFSELLRTVRQEHDRAVDAFFERHGDDLEDLADACVRAFQTGGKLLADRALSRLLRKDWPKTLDELEERRRYRGRRRMGTFFPFFRFLVQATAQVVAIARKRKERPPLARSPPPQARSARSEPQANEEGVSGLRPETDPKGC